MVDKKDQHSMVHLNSLAVSCTDTRTAMAQLGTQIAAQGHPVSFIFAFYGCGHDDAVILQELRDRFPDVGLLGGTSCNGVMNQDQLWDENSVGLLLISDPDGEYGAGAAVIGSDPSAAARQALANALEDANCPGELPELIWLFQPPGLEEEVVEGLRQIVGDRCPIVGGSSADNTVDGGWRQIGPAGVMTDGIVVAALFPSGGIGYSFQGGYEPTGPSGVVTRVGFDPSGDSGIATGNSGRRIVEIDGSPAAAVYNAWTGGALDTKLAEGGNILLETTMCPMAVDAGKIDGVPHFVLIHPETVEADGTLTTFAAIPEGVRIYGMRGNRENLVKRAGRVSAQAAAALPGGPETLAGGLVVYCAGCMLAVDDEMEKVVDSVCESFDGAPFLGCFTFGEQGCIADRNVHGNLMISAIAFGR